MPIFTLLNSLIWWLIGIDLRYLFITTLHDLQPHLLLYGPLCSIERNNHGVHANQSFRILRNNAPFREWKIISCANGGYPFVVNPSLCLIKFSFQS